MQLPLLSLTAFPARDKIVREMKCAFIFFLAVVLTPFHVLAQQNAAEDPGRAFIQSVLQAGTRALLQAGASSPSEDGDGSGVPALRSLPQDFSTHFSLDSLLSESPLALWRDEIKAELGNYVEELSDRATKSVMKRLDKEGEIRGQLQSSVRMVEILAWCLMGYLFVVTVILIAGMQRLLRFNKKLYVELRSLQGTVKSLSEKL